MFSLDVFDTLLTRTVADPADAFLLLGMDLQRTGLVSDPEKFRADRMVAETVARQRSDREDCTLEEIYRALCEEADYQNIDPQQLQAMECGVESALVQPIRAVVERFLGFPSTPLLISDMYLSSEVIRSLVDRALSLYGRSREYELFVSSELGVTKNSGRLYEQVADKYPGYQEQGLHLGDRAYADVVVPKKLGLKAEHFTGSSCNRYERIVAEAQGADAYLSLLSGCMRATRLANPCQDPRERAIWDYSSCVAAPIVILFVQWLLFQAREDGIGSLAFLARDGQIMHKVASGLAELEETLPDCMYVLASRQAWNLPSVHTAPEDIEAWAFDDTNHLSVTSFAGRIGLVASDFADWFGQAGVFPEENLGHEHRLSLFAFLREREDLHRKIEREAAERRDLVLEYFRTEGVFDSRRWGIVDIGWRGRLQQSLERLLQGGDTSLSIRYGYYFSLSRPVPVSSPQRMFFSGHRLNRAWLEHVFAADHGSVHGFSRQSDGSIIPLLQPVPEQGPYDWGVLVQHEAILHLARIFTDALRRFQPAFPDQKAVHSLVENLMFHAVERPTADEAELFSTLMTYEDQLETVGYAFVVPDLKVREVVNAALLRRPFRYANEWQEASVALKPAHYRWLYHMITTFRRGAGRLLRIWGK